VRDRKSFADILDIWGVIFSEGYCAR